MTGTKGMLHYSLEIKKQAISMYLEENMPYREIAEKLKIRRKERIQVWVHHYRREGEKSLRKPIGRPKKAESVEAELEQLRMEVALLKKFHSELRTERRAKRNIG
jgi:transposase